MTPEESNNVMQEEWRNNLQKYINDNNFTSFATNLKRGANPYYSNGHSESIFEILLSTSNRAEFLKLCVEHVSNYRFKIMAMYIYTERWHVCSFLSMSNTFYCICFFTI